MESLFFPSLFHTQKNETIFFIQVEYLASPSVSISLMIENPMLMNMSTGYMNKPRPIEKRSPSYQIEFCKSSHIKHTHQSDFAQNQEQN
jgi:hypothetical protein